MTIEYRPFHRFPARTQRRLFAAAIMAGAMFLAACGEKTPEAPATAQPPPAVPAPASPTADAAPAEAPASAAPSLDALSVDELFQKANKSVSDNRIAGPAGDNALEYYLAILAKEPERDGARDGLRELFPFAIGVVEQAINRGDVDEAGRVIDLLARADSNNYSLTILRSKLDTRRRQVERETAAAAAAAAQAAAPAPARTEPAAPASRSEPPAPAATRPAPAPESAVSPPPAPAPPPVAPAVATPAPASAPVGESRDAGIVSSAAPEYPVRAYRDRQEGWVEVEFTVAPDGSPGGIRVVRSSQARVFDREAIQAIQRSTFRPRLENGVAVSSTLRRRIEFKMGE